MDQAHQTSTTLQPTRWLNGVAKEGKPKYAGFANLAKSLSEKLGQEPYAPISCYVGLHAAQPSVPAQGSFERRAQNLTADLLNLRAAFDHR